MANYVLCAMQVYSPTKKGMDDFLSLYGGAKPEYDFNRAVTEPEMDHCTHPPSALEAMKRIYGEAANMIVKEFGVAY